MTIDTLLEGITIGASAGLISALILGLLHWLKSVIQGRHERWEQIRHLAKTIEQSRDMIYSASDLDFTDHPIGRTFPRDEVRKAQFQWFHQQIQQILLGRSSRLSFDESQQVKQVSEGRVSQMMHSLVNTWGFVERRAQRGNTCYTLSAEGIRYVTHRDRAQLPTTRGIWSTALTTYRRGRRRHVGHRIETWARQTKHADGITWFLSKLEAEARADPDSDLLWSVPTARSDRAYNWDASAIAPDAVGEMTAEGLRIPFYFEYELRARHPQGVIARLDPYESYYWSPEHQDDQPPYPVTLFVVDTEEVEATYVRTAARMSRMSLPIFVSCIPALSNTGILGRSWRPLWEPESPRLPLFALRAYQWDSLYHRMRHRPVGEIGPMRPYLWLGVQIGTTGRISEDFRGLFWAEFSYETGLTHRVQTP